MTPPTLTSPAMTAPQPRNTILVGDALTRLRQLEQASIDCIITSPPYFRLRDYQHPGQLGLEPTIEQWVTNLLNVTDELARVLVPTGTLWLNLGDSYSTHQREGAPKKSLLMGPERLILGLLQHGWIVRNKIIWAKTNTIPSSVTDRLSCTHEVIYLLTRSPRYYFGLDDIRQPPKSRCTRPDGRPSRPPRQPRAHTRPDLRPLGNRHQSGMPAQWRGPNADTDRGLAAMKRHNISCHPLGKNPGDVWHLAASNYRGAHFATYPTHLVERMLLAGCPEQRCRACRSPHLRPIHRLGAHATRLALTPSCHCPPTPGSPDSEKGIVLDPFLGSGTTAVVAEQHGRDWLGIELNPDFAEQAHARIHAARDTTNTTRKETP